jgi:hypothetical protein
MDSCVAGAAAGLAGERAFDGGDRLAALLGEALNGPVRVSGGNLADHRGDAGALGWRGAVAGR